MDSQATVCLFCWFDSMQTKCKDTSLHLVEIPWQDQPTEMFETTLLENFEWICFSPLQGILYLYNKFEGLAQNWVFACCCAGSLTLFPVKILHELQAQSSLPQTLASIQGQCQAKKIKCFYDFSCIISEYLSISHLQNQKNSLFRHISWNHHLTTSQLVVSFCFNDLFLLGVLKGRGKRRWGDFKWTRLESSVKLEKFRPRHNISLDEGRCITMEQYNKHCCFDGTWFKWYQTYIIMKSKSHLSFKFERMVWMI